MAVLDGIATDVTLFSSSASHSCRTMPDLEWSVAGSDAARSINQLYRLI